MADDTHEMLPPELTARLPTLQDGLARYIAAVQAMPVHTREEEGALAKRVRASNDLEAARQLVLSNLRHVVTLARGYLGYGLPLTDLVQEGSIGLMKAVKRFDPEVGPRLIAFAVHWIRAEIHEYVIRNWSIVKIATTKAQRKLFFNLRRMKPGVGWLDAAEARSVADELKVPLKDVLQMDARLSGGDRSLDAPAGTFENAPPLRERIAIAVDGPEQESPEDDGRLAALRRALPLLDPRSREIVEQRWLHGDSRTHLVELARKHRISPERVRQIEDKAFDKLRRVIQAQAA